MLSRLYCCKSLSFVFRFDASYSVWCYQRSVVRPPFIRSRMWSVFVVGNGCSCVFSKCCRDSVFNVLRHVQSGIIACRWSGFAVLPPGCKAHISSPIVFRSAAICHDTASEWLRRWTRNPLGSARRGSNPLGVEIDGQIFTTKL